MDTNRYNTPNTSPQKLEKTIMQSNKEHVTYSSQDSPPNSTPPTWDIPPPTPPTHSTPSPRTHSIPKSSTPANFSSNFSHPHIPRHSQPNATHSASAASENFPIWICDCCSNRWSRTHHVLPRGALWPGWRGSGGLIRVRLGDWCVVRLFGGFRQRDAWFISSRWQLDTRDVDSEAFDYANDDSDRCNNSGYNVTRWELWQTSSGGRCEVDGALSF